MSTSALHDRDGHGPARHLRSKLPEQDDTLVLSEPVGRVERSLDAPLSKFRRLTRRSHMGVSYRTFSKQKPNTHTVRDRHRKTAASAVSQSASVPRNNQSYFREGGSELLPACTEGEAEKTRNACTVSSEQTDPRTATSPRARVSRAQVLHRTKTQHDPNMNTPGQRVLRQHQMGTAPSGHSGASLNTPHCASISKLTETMI
ncbi:hypothetical protein H4582DRAFT_1303065 [Lactarius indigo]|nr:hypothetical protein H4582DRAFT_1303065 [Lactarius indigo]